MDDATRAVMPPDPEMIQVGDAIWQGPQWRGLVQGAALLGAETERRRASAAVAAQRLRARLAGGTA